MFTCRSCRKRISQKVVNTHYLDIVGVYECPHCGTVQGQCYKGDSYKVVLPYWDNTNCNPDTWVGYDLTVLGSDGVTRRHGFFNPETHRITQTG